MYYISMKMEISVRIITTDQSLKASNLEETLKLIISRAILNGT